MPKKKRVNEDQSVSIEGWTSSDEGPALIRIAYEGKEDSGITFTLEQARSFSKALRQQIRNLDAAELARSWGTTWSSNPGETLS